jgi:hypothetical protein
MTLPVIKDPPACPEFYIRLDDKLLDMFFLSFPTAQESVQPWVDAGRKVEISNRATGEVIFLMKMQEINVRYQPVSEPETIDTTP